MVRSGFNGLHIGTTAFNLAKQVLDGVHFPVKALAALFPAFLGLGIALDQTFLGYFCLQVQSTFNFFYLVVASL